MSTDPYLQRKALAQRRHEMPIIDLARWAGRPGRISVWLRFFRPLLVTLVWLATVRYVWTQFFGLADDLPFWHQVALYGVAILVILAAMLALAPLRRREFSDERRDSLANGSEGESTLSEMSQFANVPVDELAELQQAQRLVVHHDDDGGLHRAEDTDKLLR